MTKINKIISRTTIILVAATMALTALDGQAQVSRRRVRKKVVTPEQQAARQRQEQEQEQERVANTTTVDEFVTTAEIAATTTTASTAVASQPGESNNYEEPSITTEDPAEAVDQMPEFVDGGEAGLLRWLAQHVKYPAKAAQNNIHGKVMVRFLVRSDGSVTDAEVVRGVHPTLDNEAQRVCGLLPRFKPAVLDGRPVAYHYVVPVTFKLMNN